MKRLAAAILLTAALSAVSQVTPSAPVVLWEDSFPAVDTAAPAHAQLAAALPNASFSTADALPQALVHAKLLVMPYGSVFPEPAWPAIFEFLQRGGNLLALGGRPLTRPAYRDHGRWIVRPENLAYVRTLFILDYQPVPGSADLRFTTNPDYIPIPQFSWQQAWSAVIRLTDEDTSPREGSAGTIDAKLHPLAWGTRGGHKLAAPVIEIDHLRNHFVGGRWIFVAADLQQPPSRELILALADRAAEGAEDFTVQPAMPLLLPGEPLRFAVQWRRFTGIPESAHVEIVVTPEHGQATRQTVDLTAPEWPVTKVLELPPPNGTGLVTITSRLITGPTLRAVHRTAVWIRDEQFLRSGPRLTVNEDFFAVDGRPLPVVGTTYMASDVQRLFFAEPNPYVWDRDMAQIAAAGLNMLRTGWWSGWEQLVEDGVATEHTLRTLEAFLLTAHRHGLPVQFTLFAFMPEVLGGANPYLDPEARRRQRDFVTSVISRFKDVPYLAWDLINEPSFANPQRFWVTRPKGDPAELAAWNEWLKLRYPDPGALASAWRAIPQSPAAVPPDNDFTPRGMYDGGHPLASYDFHLFAQEKFADWAKALRDAIRAAGSTQLITVGQDEGGGTDRPSPAFFAPAVDFTTNHTWWLNDALLWDSLVARQPGLPMLIQETGLQREWQIDGTVRRDPIADAAMLERKVATALGTSAGAIEWLWNVNAYMRAEGEVNIGAVRVDETEKPEAEVLARFARFAAAGRDHWRAPKSPEVAILTSQALQYSVLGNLAIAAQQRAVRVMNYDCRAPAYVISENQIASLGRPKLVVLPSPEALTQTAWDKLIAYVRDGGHLLITGSPERDEHWRPTARLRDLGIDAALEPLTYRDAAIQLGDSHISMAFDVSRQLYLDALRISNGWLEKSIGKGRLLLAAYPVELAENSDAAKAVYTEGLRGAGIKPPFESAALPSGVLVRPVVLADSVLYPFVSETANDTDIDVKDHTTGARLRFRLPAGRARLVLLRQPDGKVLAVSE